MVSIREKNRIHSMSMAKVIRAHRKHLGLEQRDVAAIIGIKQEKLSRIENSRQIMPHVVWHTLCDEWNLPFDCFKTETVDLGRPIVLTNKNRIGKYNLPRRYSSYQGTSVRVMRLFINYGISRLGEKSINWFLAQAGLDPDYFVHSDNQINIQFYLDFAAYLMKRTNISNELNQVFAPLVSPVSVHSSLNKVFENEIFDGISAVRMLIENCRFYDANFRCQIESADKSKVRFSMTPEFHMTGYKMKISAAGLNELSCSCQKEFISAFSMYGDKNRIPVTVEHSPEECLFHGADQCVFLAKTA